NGTWAPPTAPHPASTTGGRTSWAAAPTTAPRSGDSTRRPGLPCSPRNRPRNPATSPTRSPGRDWTSCGASARRRIPPRSSSRRAVADRHAALAGYCAAISGVDRSIGALLDELGGRGLLEDTIVVFTSDNGFSCGHHGIWGKGNGTFPLNFWEPSITVPCIVR